MRMNRFYSNPYPPVNSLVMVRVERVGEMGAYVSLLEYGGIEGMINLTELSRGYIRSISKLVHVGQKQVVSVIAVDPQRNYIDLSKRQVHYDDIADFINSYKRAKCVNGVMTQIATPEWPVERLNTLITWPLAESYIDAYEGLRHVTAESLTNVDQEVRERLLTSLQKLFCPKPIVVHVDIQVTCFSDAGIDGIKEAFKQVQNTNVKTTVQSAPVYRLEIEVLNREEGYSILEQEVQRIEQCIVAYGGALNRDILEQPMVDLELDI